MLSPRVECGHSPLPAQMTFAQDISSMSSYMKIRRKQVVIQKPDGSSHYQNKSQMVAAT